MSLGVFANPTSPNYNVKGKVMIGNTEEPATGASYKIINQNDTTLKYYNVTDIDGFFIQELPEPSKYIMEIEYLGMHDDQIEFEINDSAPELDLGTISLFPDTEVLSEVIVTAKKKLIQSDGATLTYNVDEDPDSKVNNVIDMLRKVPMVSVDAEDNIRVKGDSNFKILVNGKEDPMLQGDVKTVLKAMPAASIKKIEVITEPGAKYDAEGTGGILNIVTTGKQSLEGYHANLTARAANNFYGFSGYGRSKIGTVTTSANINYAHTIDQGYIIHSNSLLENKESDSQRYQLNMSEAKNRFHYLGGNINLSWEPDTLNLFTFQIHIGKNGFGSTNHEDISMKNNEEILQWNIKRDNLQDNSNLWTGGNVSYQHTFGKEGRHIIFSYIIGYGKDKSNQNIFTYDPYNYNVDFPVQILKNNGSNLRNTLQIDYANPFTEKHLLEAGVKGNWLTANSDKTPYYGITDNSISPEEEERVKVKQFQDIMAVYASYTGKFNKINVKAGVRYEHTRTGLKYAIGDYPSFTIKLNDIVPNAAISYMFGMASSLRLAYQMRISRPNISQLNPFQNTLAINSVSYGNPDLKSEKYNSVSLNYSNYGGKLGGSVGVSYDRNDNAIVDYAFMKDNILHSTYANIGHSQTTQMNLNLQWSVAKGLNVGAYIAESYIDMKANQNEINSSNSGWITNYNLNIDYSFPFKLRLSAYGGGATGWIDFQSKGDAYYYYGISLSRSFFKNDLMTLTAFASNFIPPTRKSSYTQITEKSIMNVQYSYRQWIVGAGITFNLGSLRSDVKKTGANLEMQQGETSAPSAKGMM